MYIYICIYICTCFFCAPFFPFSFIGVPLLYLLQCFFLIFTGFARLWSLHVSTRFDSTLYWHNSQKQHISRCIELIWKLFVSVFCGKCRGLFGFFFSFFLSFVFFFSPTLPLSRAAAPTFWTVWGMFSVDKNVNVRASWVYLLSLRGDSVFISQFHDFMIMEIIDTLSTSYFFVPMRLYTDQRVKQI